MGSATHAGKESAQKGISANTSKLNQRTKQATGESTSQPKAAAPATVRKVHIAMPAITVKRAATSEAKKDDKGAEESEAEVKTVYHDRDAEDAMSESSRAVVRRA